MERAQEKADSHAEARLLQVHQPHVCLWKWENLLSRSCIRLKKSKEMVKYAQQKWS